MPISEIHETDPEKTSPFETGKTKYKTPKKQTKEIVVANHPILSFRIFSKTGTKIAAINGKLIINVRNINGSKIINPLQIWN